MNHAQPASSPGHTLHNGAHDGINGDKTPVLAVHNSLNAKINGTSLPSPATDSPATPISPGAAPDVKIDMDYQEQESDVRHEPLPIKGIDALSRYDDVSTVPQVGTPIDPSTIPIHPPRGTPPPAPGTLLDDVKMAETAAVVTVNGSHVNGQDDIVMSEGDNQTPPAATPGISADFSMASLDGVSTSNTRSYPGDSDDHEPPAKRARVHSDADMASTAHSATPPPASAIMSNAASPAPPPPSTSTYSIPTAVSYAPGEVNFSMQQWRFCLSTIKSLKKQKDAGPFLLPVDPVALKIPHYPSIIKVPMDFGTVERKVNSSNPSKPDPNPHNPRYNNPDEFIADVRLVYVNTLTFNGPDHVVTAMGKRVLETFDKQIKHLPLPPPVEKPKPPVVKKVATPPPPPPPPVAPPPKKAPAARRVSTSVPVIRRSEPEPVGRPKREIHPPPPKDLPYADAPKKHRKGKRSKDDGSAEQLKYCGKIIAELHRKQHYAFANPFYEPVDWQKMDLPSYPKVVKKPMDLSTIKKKLDNGEYDMAIEFYDDIKLMIRNCFLFNPAGTPVNIAGQELQRLFDDKWKGLPPLRMVESEDEDEVVDDSDDDERQRQIAQYENEKAMLQSKIDNLKNKPPKEKKKKEKKEKAPVASTSKAPPKQPKAPSKKKSKKNVTDDDVLSFEQKKDLSESIGKLDGGRLERVIQIIHDGVPEIRNSTEEIELEIDQLPAAVLTKLYNYVLRPTRQPAQPKRNRAGKGTGTGGLKRKSMDEEKEAEKIRQLEERMALFDGGAPAAAPARRDDDSEHSSDSSSGSDSSGSDSE